MPMPISVNMLRFRDTIEAHPRSKNGLPPQITTGVANTSPIHGRSAAPDVVTRSVRHPGNDHRNRQRRADPEAPGHVDEFRDWVRSSAVTVIGSSAMPQIGQGPGASRMISGSIGQVYFVPAGTGSAGLAGSTSSAGAGAGAGVRYFSGSARNFAAHPAQQKEYR